MIASMPSSSMRRCSEAWIPIMFASVVSDPGPAPNMNRPRER